MEPNKMEKEFREKLEQRTIQPSDMAWDRLDAMLSVAENKKPKKNKSWMYIAAAFLVFLLVGVLFLNQEKENQVIDNNNSVVTNDNGVQNTSATVNNEVIVVPVKVQGAVTHQSHKQNKKTTTVAGKTIIKTEKATQILPQEVIVSNEKQESPIIVRENTGKMLADATSAETAKKKSTVKVDPNSLLSAVEEELDDSFKDRVLIGAAKNFKAVRSAVANRNYE